MWRICKVLFRSKAHDLISISIYFREKVIWKCNFRKISAKKKKRISNSKKGKGQFSMEAGKRRKWRPRACQSSEKRALRTNFVGIFSLYNLWAKRKKKEKRIKWNKIEWEKFDTACECVSQDNARNANWVCVFLFFGLGVGTGHWTLIIIPTPTKWSRRRTKDEGRGNCDDDWQLKI